MQTRIQPIKKLTGTYNIPADKSVTHRAIMFNAFALKGESATIYNPLLGEDCVNTLKLSEKLGVKSRLYDDKIEIFNSGKILSSDELDVGNSGTTIRLVTGLLAGQKNKIFTITGDKSIRSRPMGRILSPLSLMGANIESNDNLAPLKIFGKTLDAIDYKMPVASAQVKSCILLAGLNANGTTIVREEVKSRDHTEHMLKAFGADIKIDGLDTYINKSELTLTDVNVFGDISSAAYLLCLAAAKKDSNIVLKNVGINPTRDGVLKVLKNAGAEFDITNLKTEIEPSGDIEICYKELKPFIIDKDLIPSLIDEIPALAVLACFINGTSIIKDAQELKVKESNRIDTVVNNLKLIGADIIATDDGMIINGKGFLQGGATLESYGDHRIAMSMAIAGALSKDGVIIKNSECVDISYPHFYDIFK